MKLYHWYAIFDETHVMKFGRGNPHHRLKDYLKCYPYLKYQLGSLISYNVGDNRLARGLEPAIHKLLEKHGHRRILAPKNENGQRPVELFALNDLTYDAMSDLVARLIDEEATRWAELLVGDHRRFRAALARQREERWQEKAKSSVVIEGSRKHLSKKTSTSTPAPTTVEGKRRLLKNKSPRPTVASPWARKN